MSWLDDLNLRYRIGRYRRDTRCVYLLDDSPDCCVNFDTLDADAVILDFEPMVDDCADARGEDRPRKCDLIALQGTESRADIVLVEVKAGTTSHPPPDPVKDLRKAMSQLRRSAYIVQTELVSSEIRLPDRVNRHAVVIFGALGQAQIRRDVSSMTIAAFRRKTGFRLEIARCGEDIGQLIRVTRA